MQLLHTRLESRHNGSLGIIAGHDSRWITGQLRIELAQNLSNDVLQSPTHVDEDWILVGVGLLQDCEVTVEEVCWHRILFACSQARRDQRPLAVQINDTYLRSATGQEIAMAAPERRAGDHAARADLAAAVDPGRDLLKPGPLVTVIEWMGGVRLTDVRCRMELVTFLEWPAESLGKRCCDRRLTAARDAYDNEDCRKVGGVGLAYRRRGWWHCAHRHFGGVLPIAHA